VRSDRAALEVQFEPDDLRGAVAQAIEDHVYCDIVYLKADATAPAQRRIAPLRLVYARGQWYVRGVEAESGELRRYRLDRMLELRPTSTTHDLADPADAPTFSTDGGEPVEVQYSRQVARWVAEREHAQCERDGTLVLTHDVVDTSWLVRHVLQYGGEAVVQTPGARPLIERAARQLLED
jgi:predicted DNA-binding transcriptional regulator YafY